MTLVEQVDALLEAHPAGREQKILYRLVRRMGSGAQLKWLAVDPLLKGLSLAALRRAAEGLAARGLARFDGEMLAPA